MNIVAFVLSLLAGLMSFLHGGCTAGCGGMGGSMAENFGYYEDSRNFAMISGAGLLVVLASIIGIVGGSLALGNKRASFKCLSVSTGLCLIASLLGFPGAIIYTSMYVIAAICAFKSVQGTLPTTALRSTSRQTYFSNSEDILGNFVKSVKKAFELQEKKVYEPVLGVETEALIEHAMLFLEDENWDSAGRYITQALNQDPKNSQAYMIKLMAENNATTYDELINNLSTPLEEEKLFQRALRFADEDYKKQLEKLAQAVTDKIAKKKAKLIADWIKQALFSLKEKDFASAGYYITQVLDQDPENSRVYMIKLMAENNATTYDELINNLSTTLEEEISFQRALKFADEDYKKQLEKLARAVRSKLEQKRLAREAEIKRKKAEKEAENEKIYQKLLAMKEDDSLLGKILQVAVPIMSYKDTEKIVSEVFEKRYQEILELQEKASTKEDFEEILKLAAPIKSYKDTNKIYTEFYDKARQSYMKQLKPIMSRGEYTVVATQMLETYDKKLRSFGTDSEK